MTETSTVAGWVAVGLILAGAAAAVAFGALLVYAGRLPHPGPIVVSLSLLTGIALVGGLITGSPEVLTLAATGIGAMAGSLASIYRNTTSDNDNGKE
jgi:MFS family permease